MFTDSVVSAFADMAGADFMWDGVKGGSRPPSSYLGTKGFRTLLREDIANRQGNVCPQCGDALTGAVEFCHVVSRGPKVRGFFPGNIFIGHAACNASTKPLHDNDGNVISGVAILTADMFKRPDAIALEWTPFAVLAKR